MEWTEGAALWLALLLMVFLFLCCILAVCDINPLLICSCRWCKCFDCWNCLGLGPHSDERVKAKIVPRGDEEQGGQRTVKDDSEAYFRWKQEQQQKQQAKDAPVKPVEPLKPLVLESSRSTSSTLGQASLPGRCKVVGRGGPKQRGSLNNLWQITPLPPPPSQR
jgi:hypothetical protein